MTNSIVKVHCENIFPFLRDWTVIGNNVTFRFKHIFVKDIISWSAGVIMGVMVANSPKNGK